MEPAKTRTIKSDGILNQNKDLSGRFCALPFQQFEIHQSGQVSACCSAWISTTLGNVQKASPLEVWNSQEAQDTRSSILDGSFRYCNQKLCPHIQNDTLPTLGQAKQDPLIKDIIDNKTTHLDTLPSMVSFSNDASCNLSCPSCRPHKKLHSEGPLFDRIQETHDKVVEAFLKETTDRHFKINVTGSGDPFASRIFREFLFDLDGEDFPNLKIFYMF